MMTKLDLSRIYKAYYNASSKPEVTEVEKAHYLSIEGKGNPSGQAFAENISALYTVAYTLKFRYKAEEQDFVVAKLEGLWWFDEDKYAGISMNDAPQLVPREEWHYRLLIRLPEFVLPEEVSRCVESAFLKKKLEIIKKVTWFSIEAHTAIQMLHKGPFDTEPETLQLLKDFSEKGGWLKNGLHHEIYLSDFNKTAPEKLRTILREPVRQVR